MKEYKGYIHVDFDATLSRYKRPWKYNVFGEVIESVKKVIDAYYLEGYHINIWTSRMETEELYEWLDLHNIHFHTVNVQAKVYEKASRFKPYMNLMIDDKAVNPMNPDGTYKSWVRLKEECDSILILSKRGKDT